MNLHGFLTTLATGSGIVPWESWLPLSLEAQSEEAWAAAWNELTPTEQNAVVERLFDDGSVFADVLRQMAVRHGDGLPSDRTARLMLLQDSAEAAERTAARLRERLGSLAAMQEAANTEAIDLAAAIVEAEGSIATFRATHIDDDYGRLVDLRGSLATLERKRAELEDFDCPAAESRRIELVDEIEGLSRQKSELEASLAKLGSQCNEAQLARDAVAAEVESAEMNLSQNQVDLDELRRTSADTAESLANLRQQQNALADELATRRREIEETRAALIRDQQSLKELADSPFAADAERLDGELTDLFGRFPSDEADAKLADTPA